MTTDFTVVKYPKIKRKILAEEEIFDLLERRPKISICRKKNPKLTVKDLNEFVKLAIRKNVHDFYKTEKIIKLRKIRQRLQENIKFEDSS